MAEHDEDSGGITPETREEILQRGEGLPSDAELTRRSPLGRAIARWRDEVPEGGFGDDARTTLTEREIKALESGIKQRREIKDRESISGPEALDEIRFQNQCVLIENYDKFVTNNWVNSYEHFGIIHGPPPTLITNLFSLRNIEPFWSIKPEELSRLQPVLRIFKIYYNSDGSEKYSIEMPFDNKLDERDLSTITNTKVSRGSGVGLMSFDWTFQGSNPATATKIIESSLRLRFESLQDISKPRTSRRSGGEDDGKSEQVRFTDFLELPMSRVDDPDTNTDVYNPNYFSFKVVAGWADPFKLRFDFSQDRADRWRELAKVIRKDRNLLILTMTNHDLEVTQEGPVYLNIEANARIDVASYTEQSDIFRPYKSLVDFETLRDNLDKITKSGNRLTSCDFEDEDKNDKIQSKIKNLKKEAKDAEKAFNFAKSKMWSHLMEEILKKDRIYSVQVPATRLEISKEYGWGGVKKFLDKGLEALSDLGGEIQDGNTRNSFDQKVRNFFNADVTIGKSQRTMERRVDTSDLFISKYSGKNKTRFLVAGDGNLEDLEQRALKASDEQVMGDLVEKSGTLYINIPFLYFGDILEVAMRALHGEDNIHTSQSTMKTIVGDIVIYDSNNNKRVSVNMADIPISMSLFQDWFVKNVYGKQRGSWPVKTFIKQVLEELIVEALNPVGCFVNVPQRKIKLSITGFTLPRPKDGTDPIFGRAECIGRVKINELRDLREEYDNVETDDYVQYQILYASEVEPEKMIADPDADADRGIPWFWLGRDRGLIKDVSFQRSDMPFLREARITEDGQSQFAKLREHYSADITMVGNNLFVPGQLIYINPSTIALGSDDYGENIAQILGLVGYYRVHKVTNVIEPGKYETKLTAIWEASGDGKSQSMSGGNQNDDKINDECLRVAQGDAEDIEIKSNAIDSAIVALQPDANSSILCRVESKPISERARRAGENIIGPHSPTSVLEDVGAVAPKSEQVGPINSNAGVNDKGYGND